MPPVRVKNPQGQTGQLDSAELPDALKNGWTLVNDAPVNNAATRMINQRQSDSGYDQNHPIMSRFLDMANPILNKPMSQFSVDSSRNMGQLESDSYDKAFGGQSGNRSMLNRVGNALVGAAAAPARVAYGIGGMTPAEAGLTAASIASANPEVAGAYWATRGAGNLIGANAQGRSSVAQALSSNATPEQVGQPFADASMVVGGVAGGLQGRNTGTVSSQPNPARIITDVVNPPPKSMAGFQDALENTLPDVVKGRNITNPAQLGKVYAEKAGEFKQQYYDNYINPVKDVPVSTNYIKGYSGAQQTHGTASIAQLDARLTDINADLQMQYEKGGAAARAAVSGSKTPAELASEAAGIRDAINKTVAEKLNISPEEVGQARQKFGQMYSVADKIQTAIAKNRYLANREAAKTPNLEITAMGAANKAIQATNKAVRGNPSNNRLQDALKDMR